MGEGVFRDEKGRVVIGDERAKRERVRCSRSGVLGGAKRKRWVVLPGEARAESLEAGARKREWTRFGSVDSTRWVQGGSASEVVDTLRPVSPLCHHLFPLLKIFFPHLCPAATVHAAAFPLSCPPSPIHAPLLLSSRNVPDPDRRSAHFPFSSLSLPADQLTLLFLL